jgi:ABC-2 type transport system permease protein
VTRYLSAEWTKLRTVRSTAGLLGLAVALTLIVSAAFSMAGSPADTTKLGLAGVWAGQVAIVVLAVLVVTNEYASGMIRTTVAATPRRPLVLLCKASTLLAVTLGAAVLAVGGALATAGPILSHRGHPPPSLGDGPTLRAATGSVLYLCLIALLAFGVGTLVRDTASAVAAVLGPLYLLPLVAAVVTNPVWQMRLQRYSPMSAGLSVQSTQDLDTQRIGPWAGLALLSAYAAAALIAGLLAFTARDA